VWPEVLVGLDPEREPEKFRPFCPVHQVTKDYPPVVFTHATADYDVPYSESEAMEAALKKHGVRHQFIRLKGNYHAWSTIHPKVDPQGSNRKAIMDFLWEHLKKK
jgi:dipeptidyl aminopeptidase/acylaminoacyl peptidase